jgi:DNA polymerase-3 subunit gamma/tau
MATFYLKHRPQTIAELDLDQVRQQLLTILQKTDIPHAYLFCGPKGLGKTSAARIFTKAVNCEKRPENLKKGLVEPCNLCSTCQSITRGNALDLIEIDAASNRGIDDIRQLRENIKLLPVRFRYKTYVIDEVHMLTSEAFNALLKTLEEPPPHALFILCTTNPEKIPGTILSRVVRINFTLPTTQELGRSLRRVISAEKLKVAEDILEKISRLSDNSFRDAHKLLEQLSWQGQEIKEESLRVLIGHSAELPVDNLFHLLKDSDVKGSLQWLWQALKDGYEPEYINRQLLERLRVLLLAFYGLGKASDMLSLTEIQQLIELFSKAAEIQDHPVPSLPLELAILEFLSPKLDSMPDKGSIVPKKPMVHQSETKIEKPKPKSEPSPADISVSRLDPDSLDHIKKGWDQLLSKLQPKNHSAAALLRSARPKNIVGNHLTIEVYYEFHRQRLETPKINLLVAETLEEVFGSKFRVGFELGAKKIQVKNNQSQDQTTENLEDLLKVAEEVFERG